MITVDTTVKEIKNDRVLKKIAHYLIYNTAEDGTEHLSDESRTLRDIQDKTPTWSAKDMAYGLNCIIENGGDGKELLFDVYVDARHYAVGGFSAGGHLAACWGLKGLGYAKYGYPAAEILMLDYPLISVWRTIHPLPAQLQQIMLAGYFGTGYSEEICRPYNIDEMADQDYPPVFMIQAEDDDVVPIWNTGEFADRLEELGVSSRYEHPKTGGHGFGLGTETEAEGWTDRAVAFWDELMKEKMV